MACGCIALVLALVVLGVGLGAWWMLRPSHEHPTSSPHTPTASEDPTEDPTDDPTDDPTTEPFEDPTTTSMSITLKADALGEVTELETSQGRQTPDNGAFIGVEVTITNDGDQAIGLAGDNFTLHDDAGEELFVVYGRFSTAGPEIPPGETATAQIYTDQASGTRIGTVTYSDAVGTGGTPVELPVS